MEISELFPIGLLFILRRGGGSWIDNSSKKVSNASFDSSIQTELELISDSAESGETELKNLEPSERSCKFVLNT